MGHGPRRRLTRREWRWMWAFQVVRAVCLVVLGIPVLLAMAAELYIAGMHWLSDLVGDFRTWCYKRDIARREDHDDH